MYARVYLEITNICNRSCSFCPGTVRDLRRMTMEEFEEETARYAEEMVKNDMIFTQLARTLEITLTDDEYRLGVERYYAAEETEFDSVTEFIQYYTEESIRENLIRDKAVMVLVENAIRIE